MRAIDDGIENLKSCNINSVSILDLSELTGTLFSCEGDYVNLDCSKSIHSQSDTRGSNNHREKFSAATLIEQIKK